MTPGQWAEVFRAGWEAIDSRHTPAGDALAFALNAMELKAREIAARGETS